MRKRQKISEAVNSRKSKIRSRVLKESLEALNKLKSMVSDAYRNAVDEWLSENYSRTWMNFLNRYEDCRETGEVPAEAYEDFENILARRISAQKIWDQLDVEEDTLTDEEEQELADYIGMAISEPKQTLGEVYFDDLIFHVLEVEY